MKHPIIPSTHLVLVGGGHSHVQVLKRLMMRPEERASLRVSLIAREVHTPYSGMLPGHVAGMYGFDEMHIDLAKLCQATNVRLIVDEVEHIDPQAQVVIGKSHPALSYELLSLNSGASPGLGAIEVAGGVTPVKPIGRFLEAWKEIRTSISESIARGKRISLVVVGAGAGGVELALAIAKAFEGSEPGLLDLKLVESQGEILAGHNSFMRRWAQRRLSEAGVTILKGFQVAKREPKCLVNGQGEQIRADHVMWTTGVSAPAFIQHSGLSLGAGGFVSVNKFLQSTSHSNVFAAGDVADLKGQSRPKSGVYAVRAGPILAENLVRIYDGRPLKPYRAQAKALAIIGNYQGSAAASRGGFFAAGRSVFRVKQWIDRRFMKRFEPAPMAQEETTSEPQESRMRCAGCGSKLPASLLKRVLARVDIADHEALMQGIGEDAALIRAEQQPLAVSTDHFPQMVSDTYRFGRIAAHHGMSDLHAMGATPQFALVNLSVQLMSPALMEEEAYLMLKGVNDVLQEEGVTLVGGHSTESETAQLGCTLIGALSEAPLRKSTLDLGDELIITKPLGVGVILAGDMRHEARGRWLEGAWRVMDHSNGPAIKLLRQFGCTSCTDVTGFGFLGHLSEMLRASKCTAEVWLDKVPFLSGAVELIESGVESSLQRGNEALLADVELAVVRPSDSRLRLLMDPQTSGGLLIGVEEGSSNELLSALRKAGYSRAAIVGKVISSGSAGIMRVKA